jgi:hypothetical protein
LDFAAVLLNLFAALSLAGLPALPETRARSRLDQCIHERLTELAEVTRPTPTLIDAYRVLFRHGAVGGRLADVLKKKMLVAETDSADLDACFAKACRNMEPGQLAA